MVFSPSSDKAASPALSDAVMLKSLSSPDADALTKNLWFFASKLAFTPASFNLFSTSEIVVSSVTVTSTLLEPDVILKVPPAEKPSISLTLDAAVRLPSFPLSSAPVRYPVLASLLIFRDCTPFTAFSPVITLTALLLDTFVVLLLYAVEKRMVLIYLDCRFLILVFRSFHAVCFHSSLVCAFFASSTLVCFAETSCWIMLSVSIPEISPDNLIVDDAISVSSYLFSSTRMPAISHTLAIISKVFSGGSSLMTSLVSLSTILIVMRFVAS